MKGHEIHLTDFLLGALCGVLVGIILQSVILSSNGSSGSSGGKSVPDESGLDVGLDSTETTISTKQYDTSAKHFTLTLEDGTVLNYNTPEEYYDLTEQYVDNLRQYYGKETIEAGSLVVVGSRDSTYNSDTVLNVAPVSSVKKMLASLYDNYEEDSMNESEALTYMRTGKLPDELPDNYEIEEIDVFKVGDITYKAYEINYDMTYYYESPTNEESVESVESTEAPESVESTESTESPKYEVIHTQEICCYSDTDDAVEIIVYQQEFDKDEALDAIHQLVGYTKE